MRLLDNPDEKADGTILLGLRQVGEDNADRYIGIEFSREEAKEYGNILIEAASHV
jgi:hypothetical protein